MEKVVILLNPQSGRGRSSKKKKQIERIFASYGIPYELFVSSSEENLRVLSKEALKKYQTIVGVGGDTTFNIIATQILKNQSSASPTLGMIGTGSANDICRSLGIDHVNRLCDAIIRQQVKKMDVGLVKPDGNKEGLYFLGSMSLGLGTVVNRYLAEFSQNHRCLSKFNFIGQGLAGGLGIFDAFARRKVPLSISLSDETHKKKFSFSLLVLLNTNYYANGLNLSPEASAFDGLLDGVIIHTHSPFHTLGFKLAVRKCTHLNRKEFQLIQSSRFMLESESRMDFQLDGEIVKDVEGCEVSVLPRALKVFAPVQYDLRPDRLF